MLTNEKYIGNNVYNRVSFKLKKKRVRNPPDMWVRDDDAFDADRRPDATSITAQGIILERHRRLSDDEMLDRLRRLLVRARQAVRPPDRRDDGMPSSAAYRHRFGSLLAAYAHIDYSPPHDYALPRGTPQAAASYTPASSTDIVRAMQQLGGRVDLDEDAGVLRVNGHLSRLDRPLPLRDHGRRRAALARADGE